MFAPTTAIGRDAGIAVIVVINFDVTRRTTLVGRYSRTVIIVAVRHCGSSTYRGRHHQNGHHYNNQLEASHDATSFYLWGGTRQPRLGSYASSMSQRARMHMSHMAY